MYSRGRLVFLFDLDGTLLDAGPLSVESYRKAFNQVLGQPYSIRAVDCSGRTDPWIVKEVLLIHGRQKEAEDPLILERIFSTFLAEMEKKVSGGFVARSLQGVKDSLVWLGQQERLSLGLLTGNLERGAFLKLAAAGIRADFAGGAYGSDSPDRDLLGPIAHKRFENLLDCKLEPDCFWIIGDSLHDISCARAAGFKVLAVSSGKTSYESLAEAKPDLLVEQLNVSLFERIVAGELCVT